MRVLLFSAINRPHAVSITREVTAWLLAHGHQVHMSLALAAAVDCVGCGVGDEELMAGTDLAISIGGDGTMLSTVRIAAPHHVPVLGINAGALGFLTELTPEEVPAYLPRVMEGDYTIEPRMMLSGSAFRGDTVMAEFFALNDMVVRQGPQGRLVTLDVSIAGRKLGRFGADGLILSTPTGSTAYGLAAGGPIIHPTSSVMALVPICPHSLSFRPLVIPESDAVEIRCEGNQHGDEMLVIADGQEPVTVQPGDRVIIHPAPERALLVKLGLFSFYDRLREKLQWGGRATS